MEIRAVLGNLTIIGINTQNLKVFWNGVEVPGILTVDVNWDADDHRVKLRVNGNTDSLYLEMASEGVVIKKERK